MVLLSKVLETAGRQHSFDEVGFLVKFLGDRLQDPVTVVPVLGSLRALVSPTTDMTRLHRPTRAHFGRVSDAKTPVLPSFPSIRCPVSGR